MTSYDVMDLTRHVDELRHQLELCRPRRAAMSSHGVVAGRLSAALDSAARLVLLDSLSAPAAEITLDLAPGSVDVRLGVATPSSS